MRVRRPGPLIVWLVPAVHILTWLLFPPSDDGRPDFERQVIAEMIAGCAVILFGTALLLSTRARFLEPLFGGLDKMYRSHRDASVAGFLILVLHVLFIPWRGEPGGGVPAGLIAFAGFLILVTLSIGPRLAFTRRWVTLGYRSWKRTHRLIGLFFIFGCASMTCSSLDSSGRPEGTSSRRLIASTPTRSRSPSPRARSLSPTGRVSSSLSDSGGASYASPTPSPLRVDPGTVSCGSS